MGKLRRGFDTVAKGRDRSDSLSAATSCCGDPQVFLLYRVLQSGIEAICITPWSTGLSVK